MAYKILAVDDDPGTTEFYRCALEDSGYEVKAVGDATAAIIVCGEFMPDALILDWEMPGGGGAMVFEKLCELQGRKLPVLFITGAPQKVSVNLVNAEVLVLKKPPRVAEILSSLETLLGNQP